MTIDPLDTVPNSGERGASPPDPRSMKNFFLNLLKDKVGRFAVFAAIALAAVILQGLTRLGLGLAGVDEARSRVVDERVFEFLSKGVLGVMLVLGAFLWLRQMKQELKEKKPIWMRPLPPPAPVTPKPGPPSRGDAKPPIPPGRLP
jgi:hypothetical protein